MTDSPYEFVGGYPTTDTVRRVYDDVDLGRAVSAYRFFYPALSGYAIFKGNDAIGVVPNRVFGVMDTEPMQVGLTLNSDTPYGPIELDLRDGPMVIEMPPGPLLGGVFDIQQRWVADLGLVGPDAGRGGQHLFLPPDWTGEEPEGYYVHRATSFRLPGGVRALPTGDSFDSANAMLRTITVRPLRPAADWTPPVWLDMNGQPQDTSTTAWEFGLDYWRAIHDIIDAEPPLPEFRPVYGDLAALGIAQGRPFDPDERMTGILEQAIRLANAQMRVQAFADRRPDREVWPGRQWQWASLRPENGDFETEAYLDVDAREKWFFQAIGASPSMFRRAVGFGSLYWLGVQDVDGGYLDGSRHYRLRIPQPVPAKLFWSITVYDAQTRSQIDTPQGKAALRSMFELKDQTESSGVDLYFGPHAPEGSAAHQWLQTLPGRGWFVYFRIYGPEQPAFDGSWQLDDFALVD